VDAASARRLGAFYTPDAIAKPLVDWALRSPGDRVLDPSCGEGAFLARAADRLLALGADPRSLPDQVAGVELEARALSHVEGLLLSRHPGLRWSRLAQGDFFDFALAARGAGVVDAVVGNPPYLRTQGRAAGEKRLALEAAAQAGVRLSADASTWAPFVAAAAAFVRPGGRLAMVVPREACFANYARPLLDFLRGRFGRTRLIALEGSWFEGATVKVALLLAEGSGPGGLELGEARGIPELEARGPAAPPGAWLASRIPSGCREAADRILGSDTLAPLSALGAVRLGVVTGEKGFFLLPAGRCTELGLPALWTPTAVSTPSQLRGTAFTDDDARDLEASGAPCRLLSLPFDYEGGDAKVDAYLERGRAAGVDSNYKCRSRKPWYSVRRQMPPADLFLGYLVKRRLRVAANPARAHSTNNVHRVTLAPVHRPLAGLVAAAALNAATMLSAELTGRISAAGALKLEPGDAPKLRFIRPDLLRDAAFSTHRASAVDRALREGRDEDAFAIADEWAARAAGWDARDLARARRAWRALRDARLGGY
jgi:SAM-dependent methyltransferase